MRDSTICLIPHPTGYPHLLGGGTHTNIESNLHFLISPLYYEEIGEGGRLACRCSIMRGCWLS